MSREKHRPFIYLDQAAIAAREEADTPMEHRPDAEDWHWSRYFLAGYALYGAALYPPLLHSMRRTPANAEVDLLNYAGRPIYRPGDVANEAGVKGSVELLPPYRGYGTSDSSSNGSRLPAPVTQGAVDQDAPTGWVATLALQVQRLWRHFRQERDIANAISLLSSLDDRTLHDIGLDRSQIATVARYGLDDPDRVSTGRASTGAS